MKIFLCIVWLLFSLEVIAQRTFHKKVQPHTLIFETRFVQIPPAFASGPDSCNRFYFEHFKGFDSLLASAVNRGDTGKYVRVYFSFIVDKHGMVYDAHFLRIASTQYAKSAGAKTLGYFFEDRYYYEKIIRQMLLDIPLWKPAIRNGITVACKVEDYLPFWIGLSAPK